ncbi:hypothetical protein HK103_005150 [Boothiomyces macroporosus]|uniref:Uncharacterized protein n=1 Tax=Boothiomyces macroporosus TaxID=261099 RepID=A0AAD5Y7N0_9FUNG|nr:hypothetical protein HK103_005150 [Boothiomyces macroporosus]
MSFEQAVTPVATLEKNNPQIYDSSVTLRQSVAQSTAEIHTTPEFTPEQKTDLMNSLMTMNFENVDILLSSSEPIEHCSSFTDHEATVTELYAKILNSLMDAYNESDHIARHHLRTIVYGCFMFAVNRGIKFLPHQHTDLVKFMAAVSEEKALAILKAYPEESWSQQCHAIAYHLEWKMASLETFDAERAINQALKEIPEADVAIEQALENTERPPALNRRKSLLDVIDSEEQSQVQQKIREKHWLTLRVKFEFAWQELIEVPAGGYSRGPELNYTLQRKAVSLIKSIVILANHFKQYEYAWYWPERANLVFDWSLIYNLIKTCRLAFKEEASPVWIARGWVLYKQVLENMKLSKKGMQTYVSFMEEFLTFVRETENNGDALVTYVRLFKDMLSNCSPQHFPIPDSILSHLVELCWDCRDESKEKWNEAFDKAMGVFLLFKYYQTRPNCAFKDVEYFTPETFILLLKFCTYTGNIEEFNMLNQDVLSKNSDVDFVNKVKIGYATFVSDRKNRGSIATSKAARPQPKLDLESINRLRNTLIQYF